MNLASSSIGHGGQWPFDTDGARRANVGAPGFVGAPIARWKASHQIIRRARAAPSRTEYSNYGHGVGGDAVGVRTSSHEPRNLADAIRRRVALLGGLDLELPPREMTREPPHFDK